MRLRSIILAGVALPLSATAAMADPISLIIIGINSAIAAIGLPTVVIGTASFVLTIGEVITAALVIGGGFAASLFGGGKAQQQQIINPGEAKSTFETNEAGELRVIGRARVGGLKFFGNSKDFDRYRLLAHCRGPIDGVEDRYLGGRSVTVEPNGDVSTPPFAKPGGSYINIKSKTGDGTETAWTELMTAFSSLWTVNHRARGIHQSLIKYTSPGVSSSLYLKLYSGGEPAYEEIVRGEKLYDPRTGLYAWSDNGVLAILHILTTVYPRQLAECDLAFIAGEATRADALLPKRGGGTEKRSRFWGPFTEVNIQRGDLLRQALMSTGTEIIARPGGLIGIRLIDDNRPPEIVIPERHILDFKEKSGPEGVERPNVCKVKYYSPERNYELTEIVLVKDGTIQAPVPLDWAKIPDEIAAVGEKVAEFSLPFCPSASQAQRIARRLFAQARGDSGGVITNMAGLATWGRRTVGFEDTSLGVTIVGEIAPPRVNDEAGEVEIPYVSRPDLSAYDAEIHEAAAPPVVVDPNVDASLAQPAIGTGGAVVTYPVGGSTVTRFGHPAPPSAWSLIEATYRIITAGIPGSWLSMTERAYPVVSPTVYHAFAVAALAGQDIEFRYRYFNSADDQSNWSPVLAVTAAVNTAAPAVPAISANLNFDGSNWIVDLTTTAPNSLHVAALVKTGGFTGWPGTIDAEPGQVFTQQINMGGSPTSGDYIFTVRSQATGGAQSATVSATVTIP